MMREAAVVEDNDFKLIVLSLVTVAGIDASKLRSSELDQTATKNVLIHLWQGGP